MLANLTTPLLGIVSTAAIGRLGDQRLLGGVALASVAFDCVFWLFGFLRMATVAFTAQALGAGDRIELRAILLRALMLGDASALTLVALQTPLRLDLRPDGRQRRRDGGGEGIFLHPAVVGADDRWEITSSSAGWSARPAPGSRWRCRSASISSTCALTVLLVLVADKGIAGAAIATVIGRNQRLRRRPGGGAGDCWAATSRCRRQSLFDRARLLRLFAVNRDIMIRTAALISAFLFFTAQGARAGDLTLAANAVLNNFLMIGSFFLDGLANAAEQLCGQSFGARNRAEFSARGTAGARAGARPSASPSRYCSRWPAAS